MRHERLGLPDAIGRRFDAREKLGVHAHDQAEDERAIAIANGGCISAVLIAAAAFASAALYAQNGANAQIAILLYLWGLAWWTGAGLREIDRFVPPISFLTCPM